LFTTTISRDLKEKKNKDRTDTSDSHDLRKKEANHQQILFFFQLWRGCGIHSVSLKLT